MELVKYIVVKEFNYDNVIFKKGCILSVLIDDSRFAHTYIETLDKVSRTSDFHNDFITYYKIFIGSNKHNYEEYRSWNITSSKINNCCKPLTINNYI